MKIWAISDMHQKFDKLTIPDVDFVICAGDATNSKAKTINDNERLEFFSWVESLPFDMIMTPGNHDTSMEASIRYLNPPNNLIILRHEFIRYKGLNIFGSPFTPTFGNGWAFNVNRSKIDEYWKEIPESLDILVTHGPPKSILDYTQYKTGCINNVGDRSLLRHVIDKKPKYHIFGHLHDERDIYNAGILKSTVIPDTCFINASCVDLRHRVMNNGVIFEVHEPFIQRIKRKYFNK